MKMDAGLDTGPVLSLHRLAIADDDDAQTLHDRLAALGAEAIVAALADIAAGQREARAAAESGATYARKIRNGRGGSRLVQALYRTRTRGAGIASLSWRPVAACAAPR